MRKRVLIAIGVLAIAIGTAGIVTAATQPKTAKACVNSHGVLKLVKDGSCGSGDRITLVGRDHQGVAKAYAHIQAGGTLDTARSWNIAASNIVTTHDGFWCFTGLSFTPKAAHVTLDYWGLGNGDIPVATVVQPPTPADCDLASAQLEIFTGLIDPGVFTSGEKLGFTIVIY